MEVTMYLEELAESIKKDLLKDKSYDRYPVRFFSMNLSGNSSNELMERFMLKNLTGYLSYDLSFRRSSLIDSVNVLRYIVTSIRASHP